jgi:hypothetical protein
MFKKVMLLAMAVAAMAVFVAPAVAQAAEWTDEGEPLATNGTITATGTIGFRGGIQCHAHIHATLTKESDAGAATEMVLSECETIETVAAVCGKVLVSEVTALPTLTATTVGGAGVIDIRGLQVHNVVETNTPFCPFPGGVANVTGGEPTVTMDNPGGATALTAGGSVIVDGAIEAAAFGELEITENAGTYGI